MAERERQLWDLVAARMIASQSAPPIRRATPPGPRPLSFAQQRLWFLHRLHPGSPSYNESNAFWLSGALDEDALAASLAAIVERHESLRTVVRETDGAARQEVVDRVPVHLHREDLSALPEERRKEAARERAGLAARRPFSLDEAPLWRFHLFKLSEDLHAFVLSVHHIVWDQGSLSVFLRELRYEYGRRVGAGPGSLRPPEELAVQYPDFASWEREADDEETSRADLAYWRERLRGAPPTIELLGDSPTAETPSYDGATHWFTFGSDGSAAIERLVRRSESTPFSVLAALFAALLSRLSAQRDLVIGTPFAGRDRRELHSMIGMLTNTLTLRFEMADDPTVVVFLERAKDLVAEAYEHQGLPFDHLVRALRPHRSDDRNPLFQVVFTFYRDTSEETLGERLRLSAMPFELGTARFDLELYLWQGDGTVSGKLVYRKDLFEADAIDEWAELLRTLVLEADRRPQAHLSELRLLSAEEREAEIRAENDTERSYPRGATLPELLRERTARDPDAVALAFDDDTLTYRQLAERSRDLAVDLTTAGVEPGQPVCLVVEPSTTAIVAMLGTLEAGAFYVPLDPDQPTERLRRLVHGTGARVVVTMRDIRSRLDRCGVRTLCADDPTERGSAARADGPSGPRVCAEDPAYAMYTSGSTGAPKAVVVPHRAVACLALGTDFVQIGPDDRIAQASNLSFDASTFEIFGALLHGARLVGIPRRVLLRPRALGRALREARITILFVTSALFQTVAHEAPDAFKSLRYLLFGGERIPPDAATKIVAAGPPRHLVHVYGPTENTTFSTAYTVTGGLTPGRSIPIGRPIANTQAYVLDEHLEPVPSGAPGELYLGGDGLAIGYLDRPERTEASFVPNPFATPGNRLYRSGDVVRRRRDGELEFLGRRDRQLKIRGFRVEPTEIEAALASHPKVVEATVLADRATDLAARQPAPEGATPMEMVPSKAGQPSLIALVVPTPEQLPSLEELRQHLRSRLPDYMVPTRFIPVEALPRTPTGKLERELGSGRLRALVETRLRPAAEPVAPRTPLERKLAEVWRSTLWLERDPGVFDDFFELGGDSLLAVDLISRAERALEVELPLAALFRLKTIASLAEHVERSETDGVEPGRPYRTASTAAESASIRPGAAAGKPAILVVDAGLPYPDRDAGSRRLFGLLRLLRSLEHPITLLPDADIAPEPYASQLRGLGVEIVLGRSVGGDDSPFDRLRAALPHVQIVWLCKPGLFERYAPIVRRHSSAKIVYDTVDLHFRRLQRAERVGASTGPAGEWESMRERELANARAADVTVTVTDVEREILEAADVGRVVVVPTIHELRPPSTTPFQERHGVLFIGSYRHAPNVDAALWLCEAIMPRVWRKRPELTVTLLGSSPTATVRALRSERVAVPGYVPEVAPFFDGHRVAVAPLVYGAGMKGKVGQSLEHGLPLVSTPVGIEGMNLVDGTDVLVARSSAAFAKAVLRLYRDSRLWQKLAMGGAAKIRESAPARVRQRLEALVEPLDTTPPGEAR